MSIRNMITKMKLWIKELMGEESNRPKIPRKKLQIQFKEADKRLEKEITTLRKLLDKPDLQPSVRILGNHILHDVERFKELHLFRINKNRLDKLPQSFLPPTDFSLWVLYRMYALTEEIYHFVKTSEVAIV